MNVSIARKVATAFAFTLMLCIQAPCRASTTAGTTIENTATLTFTTERASYSVVSNSVSCTVMAVGSLVVSPKLNVTTNASDIAGLGQTVTRSFQITNTGNIPNTYTIQSVSPSAGSIVSVAYMPTGSAPIPVTLEQTASPTLGPQETLNVQVMLSTSGVASGTTIKITLVAQEAIPGNDGVRQSDNGQVVSLVASAATFTAPEDPANPSAVKTSPASLVNGLSFAQAQPGSAVNYTLSFENTGGSTAMNTALLYSIPAGLHPNPSSVQLNGVSLKGATLSGEALKPQNSARSVSGNQVRQTSVAQNFFIPVGDVAPLQKETLQFTATVDPDTALGSTYISSGTLQADGITPIPTTSSSVFVGTANIVYDGLTGPSLPIAGATISIVDPASGAAMTPSGTPLAPNLKNSNPFITGSDGSYGFGLGAEQYAHNATYYVFVSAPGYLNRKLQAVFVPISTGLLYSVTLTALDGQPLASAGGYTLSKATSMSLESVYGVLGNIPLFTPHVLSISESVDRSVAGGGDRVVFTVQVSSNASTALGATSIVATLPAGLVYAPGTSLLDGKPLAPTVQGRILTWNVPTLDAPHTIVYASVILPDAVAGTTVTSNVSVSAALPLDPTNFTSASTTCSVQIVAGIFGDRIIITGRVFVDAAGTGRFTRSDSGVGGVRIYLEDGESVVTDELGRFTFPAARPGLHVMRLDTSTLPAKVTAYDDRSYDSRRSTRRLVHGLFDSGLMQDVNFALRSAS